MRWFELGYRLEERDMRRECGVAARKARPDILLMQSFQNWKWTA